MTPITCRACGAAIPDYQPSPPPEVDGRRPCIPHIKPLSHDDAIAEALAAAFTDDPPHIFCETWYRAVRDESGALVWQYDVEGSWAGSAERAKE